MSLPCSFAGSTYKEPMRKLFLTAGVALIPMLATTAFAQSSGEVDPAQGKAPPVAKQSPEQRAAGRSQRKSTGQQAARGPQIGEGPDRPEATAPVSSDQRKAATAERRASARAANKAGELPRGGDTDAPEKQRKP
jgi:hypothetical protein